MLCTYAVGCDSGHQCAHGISHDPRYSIWMANLSEKCSDPEIAEITKISSFREKSRFWRFWRFLALSTILARIAIRSTFLARPSKVATWTNLASEAGRRSVWRLWSETWIRPQVQGLTKVARWTSDLPKSAPRCLYIDHFQLPPWWKMTGEDGDRFGGRR